MQRELDYQRHYSFWHDNTREHFDLMVAEYEKTFRNMLPALGKGAKILEVGAGVGFALQALHNLGYAGARGMDANATQIAAAAKHGVTIEHVPVSASPDYFRSLGNTQDCILAFDVLEHIPKNEQLDFLDGVVGALKSDGVFICKVPNANSAVASRFRYIDWTHECSFSEHSLDFILHNAGLVDIKVDEAEPLERGSGLAQIPKRIVRLWQRFVLSAEFGFKAASRIPLSPNLVAVARKA